METCGRYAHCLRTSARGWLQILWRLVVVYLLFSLTRLLFYLFNLSLYPGLGLGRLLRLMLVGLRFDTVAIIYTNLLFLLISLLPTAVRWRRPVLGVNRGLYVVTNGLALAMNLADTAYYPFTRRRSTLSVFSEFQHEGGGLLKIMAQFLLDYWYLLLIWLGVLAALWFLYGRDRRPHLLPGRRGRLIYFGQELLVLLAVVYLGMAGARGSFDFTQRPIRINNAGMYAQDVREIGIILNTPFSVYRTAGKKTLPRPRYYDREEDLVAAYDPVIQPHPGDTLNRMNLCVIIVESLSRDYISSLNPVQRAAGYEGYTPFLDSLVPHSLTYLHSLANGHKSVDAVPSIVASIPMMVEPLFATSYATNRFNSLASLLKPYGYRSAFFHGAHNGSMGFDAFARSVGFDAYYGYDEYPDPEREDDGYWGVWDEPFLQFTAQTLDGMPQPFFATLFTITSHHPFNLPARYAGVFPEGDQQIFRCIGYVDMALKRFFETARTMDWYERTIFVITGDHTSPWYVAERPSSLQALAVPIIFFLPGGGPQGLRDEVASQVDIMPTLLGLIGFPEPYVAFGQDLLRRKDGERAYGYTHSIHQLVQGPWVLHFDEQPTALYNWREDPGLQDNRLGQDSVLEGALVARLKGFIQQYTERLTQNRMTVGGTR